jgi:hypothetical protein
MAISTCCGAETTMPEIGLCPECLEHCDWEEIDEEELLEDQKTENQINELQINKNN